ncbi:hypothetical protein [Pseudonocardia endophytica]|uniref:Uncharacterized protein n=1 Tax=Pseudonocardia endophytica TaxID=401976 RepID=A0A4R1HWP1_PSEEN|nr:hypothetical protein [Pseudonocardia endophytica]TCK25485.1 hypothetical protein EV378_1294 [Pseudonocardia endophytica]
MTTAPIDADATSVPAELTPGRRPEFAAACAGARAGFQDVVNLAVVADGLQNRDEPDPRTTLNRLIAFGSVRAWERFVRDLAGGTRGDRLGCLRGGPAAGVLAGLSGGRLPAGWRIAFPRSGTGTTLAFGPERLTGTDDDLGAAVDWWVNARHGLTHRRLPRDHAWPVDTDAYDSDGADVGATTARFALALFLQLADQSIRVLADAAGMARPEELWLPAHWTAGRATAEADAPPLWTGIAVDAP